MEDKIKQEIINSCPDIDFTCNSLLIDEGVLDSIAIILIISNLEEKLDIHIPYEEVTTDNFNSLDSIVLTAKKYL